MTMLTPKLRTTYKPDAGCSLSTIFWRIMFMVVASMIYAHGCAGCFDEPNSGEIKLDATAEIN